MAAANRSFNIEVRYPRNYRFIEVSAPDLKTAKQQVRARDDHHDKILGMRRIVHPGEKA